MDNVTHTLVGLAAGELIHRSLPAETNDTDRSIRRRLLLIACAVASNFPDLDLVLSPLLPPPLGYLLHHRGHTHTILYSLPQAFMMIAFIWFGWRNARELLRRSQAARTGLLIATLLGFTLHLSMDFLNSYGIHPFHPFDSRWFYGDMIFIIEPLFWISCGAPLAVMIQKRKYRTMATALLIGLPALFAFEGFLAWYSVVMLALVMVGLSYLELKSEPRKSTALIAAAMTIVVFIAIQSFSSGLAKRALAIDLESETDGFVLHDVAASPLPSNPFCWTFVSVESNETKNSYRLRRGVLSVASFVTAESCPLSLFRDRPAKKKTSGLEILGIETGDLAQLRSVSRSNCHLAAWLRFARAPLVDANHALDMRFSSGGRPNFTTLELADFAGQDCPKGIPAWGIPRADLLGETE